MPPSPTSAASTGPSSSAPTPCSKACRARFAAIGPTTAAELERHGASRVLTPHARYDSESLLALPEMQAVGGQKILIFRGVGGRELLADELRARGADVRFAECYRRINPQQDASTLSGLWQNRQLHALVVTSSEVREALAEPVTAAFRFHRIPIRSASPSVVSMTFDSITTCSVALSNRPITLATR